MSRSCFDRRLIRRVSAVELSMKSLDGFSSSLFLFFFQKANIIGYVSRCEIRLLIIYYIWCFNGLRIRANVTKIGLISITDLYGLTVVVGNLYVCWNNRTSPFPECSRIQCGLLTFRLSHECWYRASDGESTYPISRISESHCPSQR